MATQQSDQRQPDYRKYPIDDHGKLRFQYFSVGILTPITVAYAANDQVELFKLPPGRKRILPWLSRLQWTAFGAGRAIDIGHRAFMARPPADADPTAENGDAFIDGFDVAAAQATPFEWFTPEDGNASSMKYDLYSIDEMVVFMTILGGTMPIGAKLSGFCAYIYE